MLGGSHPGSLISAEVVHIVSLDAYRSVKSDNVETPLSFPYYSQIYDAVKEGVTEDDVRAERLLIIDCAVGQNSWERHIALEPHGMKIGVGEHIELEAGNVRRNHVATKALFPQAGTLGKIIRKIPYPHPRDTFDVWGLMIKCNQIKE